MTDKQLLKKVKAHWKENLQKAKAGILEDSDIGADKCAFCRAYTMCRGCPIEKKSGALLCLDTPYTEVCSAMLEGTHDEKITAVEQMCKFLDTLKV